MFWKTLLPLLCGVALVARGEPLPPLNALILESIRTMPNAGGYSVSSEASQRLRESILTDGRTLQLSPDHAQPSYCSGATYLVFLETCQRLLAQGKVRLDPAVILALRVMGQRDGEGVWGRWNANGPGTPRLFYELELGRNFTDWSQAKPGDFMKIFWNTEIGKLERGHSVVFLGTEQEGGVEYVRFWSSNQGVGYGEKRVSRKKIPWAIFSRFERPENLARIASLPKRDPYLASLLKVRSSQAEVRELCGLP